MRVLNREWCPRPEGVGSGRGRSRGSVLVVLVGDAVNVLVGDPVESCAHGADRDEFRAAEAVEPLLVVPGEALGRYLGGVGSLSHRAPALARSPGRSVRSSPERRTSRTGEHGASHWTATGTDG